MHFGVISGEKGWGKVLDRALTRSLRAETVNEESCVYFEVI